MPRAKDPIADLKAHRDRQADLKAKEKKLKTDAAQFLGELMMKAGLDAWSSQDLQDLVATASEHGPEKTLAALRASGAPNPQPAPPHGAHPSPGLAANAGAEAPATR